MIPWDLMLALLEVPLSITAFECVFSYCCKRTYLHLLQFPFCSLHDLRSNHDLAVCIPLKTNLFACAQSVFMCREHMMNNVK